MDYTQVRIGATTFTVPYVQVGGRTVIVMGGWLKVAEIKDEDYEDGDIVPDPDQFIATLQQHKDLGADIFTFGQRPNDPAPRFPFYHEWDSVAAIPITSFTDWWTNHVSRDLRRDVRKAAKLGVEVRTVPFTDDFVRGIVDINDETPIRQGTPFLHYHKSFEAVKLAHGTYLERSEFVGAFVKDELIGYLKIIYVDRLARLMQVLAKNAHRDKRPANALIAKAVELCEAKHCSHLTYGKYRYAGIESSLTRFKHRNGFQEIMVPKYYVALTTKGRAALRLHLHHGAKTLLPVPVRQSLRYVRASIYRHILLRGAAT